VPEAKNGVFEQISGFLGKTVKK